MLNLALLLRDTSGRPPECAEGTYDWLSFLLMLLGPSMNDEFDTGFVG